MTGNELFDNIINSIPEIIESGIDLLIPETIQIWFENNYKLIFLIFLTFLLIGLTIAVIKDTSNRS